jgi:hypothetical protein
MPLLYHLLFERGPMPIVALFTSFIAWIVVLVVRPRSGRVYLLTLLVCLLPLLSGLAGYFLGIASANAGWQEFLATNPSPEVIESARENLATGKMSAWDPFIVGLVLSLPLVVLNSIIFVLRRDS